MIKCAIYCDFTWFALSMGFSADSLYANLRVPAPVFIFALTHTHSHTRTQWMLYFTVILIYGNFMRVRSNVGESSSPRVDSQIRPHNNNKSGNYCIKCLIYVFSQLFYLWACTVHCSTGFLCASTASLGPCPALPCLAPTWLNFAPWSQVTIELYLLSHAEHYEFPVSTRHKKLRNLFDIPMECHTQEEAEREGEKEVLHTHFRQKWNSLIELCERGHQKVKEVLCRFHYKGTHTHYSICSLT